VRIAFLAASQIPSLTANSIRVMKVCQAFVELGHEVRLWVPRTPTPLEWEQASRHYGLRHRFPITFVDGLAGMRRWDVSLRSAAAAARWNAGLYYVWPYQAAAFLSVMGRPTVLEVHDRPAGVAGPLLFRIYLRGRGARRVLPITESLRLALERDFGPRLRPPFTRVLPSGVDLAAYESLPDAPTARAKLGFTEKLTATYTGHLYPGRGLELMVNLARRNPDVSFVWAGGRPEDVAAWTARLNDDGIDNIRVLGFIPNADLPLVQAAGDILLMPYARKIAVSSGGDTAAYASPMKAFEYLAAGRAILASDLPVFGEVLDADNCLLLPPEDVDAWDHALRRVLADRPLRETLASQARRDARAYGWTERARRAIEGLDQVST
jgi:glycosyltransferase involved in cell wall biosynthesis